MPRIHPSKSGIVSSALISPSSKEHQPSSPKIVPADSFEKDWEVVDSPGPQVDVPLQPPVAPTSGWTSMLSWGAPVLKSALNTGMQFVGTQLSTGVSVANDLLSGISVSRPNAPTPSDNVFDLAFDSKESTKHFSNGQSVYRKELSFSGAQTIAKLGAYTAETRTMTLDGVELEYVAQTLLDLSRGEAGTQDLFIGGPEVSRENTGGQVTDNPDWKTNPVWFEESLRKFYGAADYDADTTRLITTFINQRVLNNLIYNLQDGVNQNLGTLILMGDVTMSWRVFREAPFMGAKKELFVKAIVEGTVPYAQINDEMVPEMGSFRGAITVNLSANTARATYGASLNSKKLGIDSSSN